jgi:YidC/Oxa1 family membrane protein insertase
MNLRKVYLGVIVVLSMALFYEWNSENQKLSEIEQLRVADIEAATSQVTDGGSFVYLENNELRIKISTSTGSVVESRLKKYGVENIEGSPGVRVFGSSNTSPFKYYLKTGFTGKTSSYVLHSYDNNSVVLKTKDGDLTKEFTFLPETYELLITDSSSFGSSGKAFAALYRTEGRSLDLKSSWLQGGMMNNSSYQGVAFSTDQDPYETTRLRNIDESVSYLSRSGWVSFIQKYFFAALIGSEDSIYNFFAHPADSGVYRMGYTVEKERPRTLYLNTHTVYLLGQKLERIWLRGQKI